MRRPLALALAGALGLSAAPAVAGGLDLPIVYTARHAGMGGTAIAGVNDASAVWHNPAGLAGVSGLSLLGNLTLVDTNLETSPSYPNQNVQSGDSVAPAPFIAAAYRPIDKLSVGLGAYPLGAVSGTFKYNDANGVPTLNSQNTIVYEISPAVSYTPIKQLSLGVGYRVTIIQFDRHLGAASNPVTVDINSSGANFTGFRFGIQWHPLKQLSFGAVYRPEIQLTSSADSGHLLGQAATNIQAQLNYPSKLGAGVRVDLDPVSFAVDYEFVSNSQFKTINLNGDLPHGTINAPFLFNWSDSSTIKVGVEYRPTHEVALRAGYAWDGSFSNPGYPDTFMQPPVAGNYLTLGAGYRGESWAVNVALSYRPDETAVITANEVASATECPLCAKPGTYGSRLNMALVDFSKDFNL